MTTTEVLHEAAQALAARDLDAIVGLYAGDAVFEDVPDGESYRGTAAIRGMFEALFSAAHSGFRIAAVRAGENWGVIEWVWSGRTRKTGVPFEIRGVSVLEMPGPKVAHETIYYDPAPALR